MSFPSRWLHLFSAQHFHPKKACNWANSSCVKVRAREEWRQHRNEEKELQSRNDNDKKVLCWKWGQTTIWLRTLLWILLNIILRMRLYELYTGCSLVIRCTYRAEGEIHGWLVQRWRHCFHLQSHALASTSFPFHEFSSVPSQIAYNFLILMEVVTNESSVTKKIKVASLRCVRTRPSPKTDNCFSTLYFASI